MDYLDIQYKQLLLQKSDTKGIYHLRPFRDTEQLFTKPIRVKELQKTKQNTKKIPRPCQKSLYDNNPELRNVTAIPVGPVGVVKPVLGLSEPARAALMGQSRQHLHSDCNQNSLQKQYPVSSEICKTAERTSKATLQKNLKGQLSIVSSSRQIKNPQDALDMF